jgi:hypothetical protein
MFNASVTVQVGNGVKTLFCSDRWLDGTSLTQVAPELVQAVQKRVHKTRTVAQALQNAT